MGDGTRKSSGTDVQNGKPGSLYKGSKLFQAAKGVLLSVVLKNGKATRNVFAHVLFWGQPCRTGSPEGGVVAHGPKTPCMIDIYYSIAAQVENIACSALPPGLASLTVHLVEIIYIYIIPS